VLEGSAEAGRKAGEEAADARNAALESNPPTPTDPA